LPTEKELKAEAKARREREKQAAEEARKAVREEERKRADAVTAAKAEARRLEAEQKKGTTAAISSGVDNEAKAREEARRLTEANALAKTNPDAAVDKSKPKSNQPMVHSWETPGSKSKQQRLADLFDAYQRDVITPAEYHRARAKIVAE
jgi:hypothetical protein